MRLFIFSTAVIGSITGLFCLLIWFLLSCPDYLVKPTIIMSGISLFYIFYVRNLLGRLVDWFWKKYRGNRNSLKLDNSKKELEDTIRWTEAMNARKRWEYKNPYKNHSDPEMQELIRLELGAYMLWLDSHPQCYDPESEVYMKHLSGSMNDWVL